MKCAICAPSATEPAVLCAEHDQTWCASKEFERFGAWVGKHGTSQGAVAFTDFVRRMQAEARNGGRHG